MPRADWTRGVPPDALRLQAATMTGHPFHCVVLITGPHTLQTSIADQIPQRLPGDRSERLCHTL